MNEKTYQWSTVGKNPENKMLRVFWIAPCDAGFNSGNRVNYGMNDYSSAEEAEKDRLSWEKRWESRGDWGL